MWLDGFTAQNLELFHPNAAGGVALIDVLDNTESAMGGRLLRNWISLPLLDQHAIVSRHETVAQLLEQPDARTALGIALSGMPDMERLCSRTSTGRISPKEMARLRDALDATDALFFQTEQWGIKVPCPSPAPMPELRDTLTRALVNDPATIIGKGEAIASEYDPELARLRGLLSDAQGTLDAIRDREAEATGIPSLKLAFNNVFGYYLEVRNSHKDKVPEHWHRKQTLVNAERYITDELKKFETEVLGAEEKIKAIELRLFGALVHETAAHAPQILANARWVATLDVLASFANIAEQFNYVQPSFHSGVAINIQRGRHAVIERVLPEGTPYIANSLEMDANSASIAMITGPNMSGKSALLRQTALIQILAQSGSFVPATSADLPILDRLFVRVGASDNLSKGESTFMVEMNETATILNNK
jgi:DNA mismatch repair protein MutS